MGRLRIEIGGVDVTCALEGAPSISDPISSVSRSLSFDLAGQMTLDAVLGKTVALYYDDSPWFIGTIQRRKPTGEGKLALSADDPLIRFQKHSDDFYFKKQTATQIVKRMAEVTGLGVASLCNTKTVFPYLFYPGAEAAKVAIDAIARTRQVSGKKYWFRYDAAQNGLVLFERELPENLWVFKRGLNLADVDMDQSIEDTYAAVKIVNRETGKTVIKKNKLIDEHYAPYSQLFEEVSDSKTSKAMMEATAAEKLDEASKVETKMSISAFNPRGEMGQFFSGDAVYVEEPRTGMASGYYVNSVTQLFAANDMIMLNMELTLTADLPELEFDDADEKAGKKAAAVYIVEGDSNYHKRSCKKLVQKSPVALSKVDAKALGKTACTTCKPK